MKPDLTYIFRDVANCNMCNAGLDKQKKIGRRLNCSNGFRPKKKIGISTTVMKCRNCGLIYANPLPIPCHIGMHYDIPVSDYYPEGYLSENQVNATYKEELDFIKEFKNYSFDQMTLKVLDIGCGIGDTLVKYKTAGFDVYGIEPSTTFFEKSKTVLGEDVSKVKNALFEEADFQEGQFDFVYSFNVLEHVYDPNAMIRQALYWLKPGGLLGLVMPSSASLASKVYNFYYALRATDLVTNISPMHSPFHLYEFGKKSFIENARINNYEIYRINTVATITSLPTPLDRALRPIMRMSGTGIRLEVIIRKP